MSDTGKLERAVAAAKEQISACDKQSAVYKAALRNLGEHDEQEHQQHPPNSFTVQWIMVRLTDRAAFSHPSV